MDGDEDFARSSLVENEGIDLHPTSDKQTKDLEVSHFSLILQDCIYIMRYS